MQNYRFIIAAAALGMCLFSAHAYAVGEKDREITLVVPAKVLQGLIDEVLPVEINLHEKVSGTLWIRSIEHLRLGVDKVWFTASIRGNNIAYKGKIGGLPANLQVDTIDSTLRCETSIRYDMKTKLLYVRPKVAEEGKKRDILLLLLSVFGDDEYPVEITKLKPIQARISNKPVEIDMDIANIYTVNDRLFVSLQPSVKAVQE